MESGVAEAKKKEQRGLDLLLYLKVRGARSRVAHVEKSYLHIQEGCRGSKQRDDRASQATLAGEIPACGGYAVVEARIN